MVIKIKHYQLKNILINLDHKQKDIINNLKKSDTWKIQLTIANNFISSIANDEEHVMHSKSDNRNNDEVDELIEKSFESLKNRYESNLESMRGTVFDYVYLMYYKSNEIDLNHGGSYIKTKKQE